MSGKAEVRVEKVIIPTYEIGEYNKNPMFLEKRVYQGSSGRVYPHPVCESISDEKKDKEYWEILKYYIDNDQLIGGRL